MSSVAASAFDSDRNNFPHLILNFDINRTIILQDGRRQRSESDTLVAVLAESIIGRWGNDIREQSYASYIREQLQKKFSLEVSSLASTNPEYNNEFFREVSNFVEWIQSSDHELKDEVLHKYNSVREHILESEVIRTEAPVTCAPVHAQPLVSTSTAESTEEPTTEIAATPSRIDVLSTDSLLERNQMPRIRLPKVFQSFYELIGRLREVGVPFTLVFRTYGEDLHSVLDQLGRHPKAEGLVDKLYTGRIRNKILSYSDGSGREDKTIERASEIFEKFLNSDGYHFGITDNYMEWLNANKAGRFGKPFFYDQSGRLNGIRNLSLFFDDSFTTDQQSIICPYEISDVDAPDNQKVIERSLALKDKLLFRVDAVQAIADRGYFINLVNKALREHQYSTLPVEHND